MSEAPIKTSADVKSPADLAKRYQALAEEHRLRATESDDEGWQQLHAGLADTYDTLAQESENAADYARRLDQTALERLATVRGGT